MRDDGGVTATFEAIGSMLLAGRYALAGAFACPSGHASFELEQKASLRIQRLFGPLSAGGEPVRP